MVPLKAVAIDRLIKLCSGAKPVFAQDSNLLDVEPWCWQAAALCADWQTKERKNERKMTPWSVD